MPKPKIPNSRKAALEHRKRIERYAALINQLYDKLNKEAAKIALSTGHDPAAQFLWSDYPETRKALKELQEQYVSDMKGIVMAGTSAEWKESNLVQDLVAQKLLKAYTGTTKAGDEYSRYFQTDPDALKALQQRKAGGMNLSQRVWNLSEQYKTELEMALSAAIEPGTSAMELAADIKTYLNEPDKMFRRFRYKDEEGNWQRKWKQKFTDAEGKVHFIDADPKAYHPGRGVYRSSARNAQRLARTEINMAYRKAEQERWKSFDFVVGYEVKVTKSEKHVEDICDCLKGKYRKDFKFMGWHPSCYKDDMDVLTKVGWKRFRDVSDDDLIMSLNPETREVEWVSVVDQQCYDFDGELVRFYNKSLDCAVTPDHRMIYLNKSNGQIKYCPASEFRSTKGAFYRGAEYSAKDKEWFELGDKKIRFDDYCAFMGYYLSDGCLQHDTGIVIAQQAGCFAFYDIVDIVAKMGYNIKFTPDVINIYNTALNRYLSQFGVCNKKFIPDEIKTASKRQIQIFLDAFIKCDGHTRKCKSFVGNHGNAFHSDKEERMYFTTSERLAGDLSELILKVGHRPSFEFQEPKTSVKRDGTLIKSNHLCYRIRECYSTTATVFKKEYLPYSGKVYDLTLDRNHIMYVRRNGKCFWGSNCMCYTIPILKTEDEFFDDDEDAKSVNEVEDVPQGFKDWIKDNEERIEKAEKCGTLPYFIRDNKSEVDRILNPDKEAKRDAGNSPYYGAAMKLGRSATKEAMKIVENIGAPELTEVQKKNILELADALGAPHKEIKPMSFLDADQGASNPTKDKENCQSVVVAFEARRRGIDCYALPYSSRHDSASYTLGERFQDAWINPKTGKVIESTIIKGANDTEIISKLKRQLGADGRYVLGINENSGRGHLVSIERFDGKIIIKDDQVNDFISLDSLENISYLEVIKIDKAILNISKIKSILGFM